MSKVPLKEVFDKDDLNDRKLGDSIADDVLYFARRMKIMRLKLL